MDRGSILFDTAFKFEDGEVGTKLIVTLNEPQGDEPYILCKTTSNPKNKPKTPGCHAKLGLFFIPASTESFPRDTWLQLYHLYEIPRETLLQKRFRHDIEVKDKLSSAMIGQVINCIKICPDVERYHLSLICE